MPKRCGHMGDKSVIPVGEMVGKIHAAIESRDEMLVVARTDARAPERLDSAIARGRAYVAAGADVSFVEALESPAEFERDGAEGFGVPLVFNWVEGGRSPGLTADEIAAVGFQVLLLPIALLLAATRAMQGALASIREHGTTRPGAFGSRPFDDFTDLIGLTGFLADQARYGSIDWASVAIVGALLRRRLERGLDQQLEPGIVRLILVVEVAEVVLQRRTRRGDVLTLHADRASQCILRLGHPLFARRLLLIGVVARRLLGLRLLACDPLRLEFLQRFLFGHDPTIPVPRSHGGGRHVDRARRVDPRVMVRERHDVWLDRREHTS